MYRVLKEKGNNSNVMLENMETKASIIVGRITISLLDILNKAGHKIGDDGVSLRDEWNFEVNEETGKEIASKAMTMTKPVRDQRKYKVEELKKPNNQIDAMDVLLGLANYN
jgi:hypothetical protein